MSMSTHIVGFHPPDEEFLKMKRIWDACEDADVKIPDRVYDFFDGERPDPLGITINIEDEPYVEEYELNGKQGFEVHLDKVPKNIRYLRFYNSW